MPNATTINIPENININIGIPGQKGTNGSKGEKGDPFRYEDFTPDQLQALKGEKGDKGETGVKGEDGKPGKAFTYEDFTPDQLAALKGEKGDPGDKGDDGKPGKAFTYEDFTPDQLAALKGEKGETGDRGEKGDMPTISNTVHFLKQKHVYLPGEDLDTVLTTVLDKLNEVLGSSSFMIPYETVDAMYPFEVDTFNDGDENLTVHGYNHFKVQIANEEPVEILNNIAIVPVPKNTGDFVNVKYINFLGEVVASKNIEKVKEDDTPAVIYQENNPNMKLSVKGTKAVLEFIQGGRNELRSTTLKPLENAVKRLIIDLANVDKINGYVTLPFVPEKVQILNYKANNLNLSFQGDYYGMTKIVSEKPIPYRTLNSNGEYEVSSLNGKSFTFSDEYVYVNDAL